MAENNQAVQVKIFLNLGEYTGYSDFNQDIQEILNISIKFGQIGAGTCVAVRIVCPDRHYLIQLR